MLEVVRVVDKGSTVKIVFFEDQPALFPYLGDKKREAKNSTEIESRERKRELEDRRRRVPLTSFVSKISIISSEAEVRAKTPMNRHLRGWINSEEKPK